nr:O-antigen ligase family protein [Rhodoferax sp.]
MPEDRATTTGVWNARLALVCLSAVSVSLPMAWISLAKVLVLVVGLGYLVFDTVRGRRDTALSALWTPRLLVAIPLAFAASLLWTGADMPSALNTLLKHIKLVEITLLAVLVRSVAEARIAITAFVLGQGFLLLSSWLLFVGVPVPWQAGSAVKYEVFSTYLDQSLMFATSAGVFWYLRAEQLWPRWVGIVLAVLALVNTLLLLEGRSGYLVALTTIALAIMWTMPRRLRVAALLVTPVVLLLGLSLGSAKVHERVTKIFDESQNFAHTQQVAEGDSSGWRLNAWLRSVQAVQEKPLHGHGVGNWAPVVKRIQGSDADAIFGQGNHSNPHEEYLLWAVELGLGGALLLLGLFLCMARDALRFPPPVQQALLGVVAATAVACLFNSALYDDLMGDYFCVSLGLLMALGLRSSSAAFNQAPNTPVTA